MFAPKYNYWNNYATENSTYQSYPYGNEESFHQSSYSNGSAANITNVHTSPNDNLPIVKPSDFQPHSNNNTDYIKEFLERLNEKEREEKIAMNKAYPTQTNLYESYPYNVQNQVANGNEQISSMDGKLEMIKKSSFLSKFYKPDGTPVKGLWDTDGGLREQRTYKYDPKPLERRKNPRSFVPDEKKTDDYWEKRRKNNLAARKSREDRRKKEIEILKSVEALRNDNLKLKVYAQKIMAENQSLKYEIDMLKRV